MPFPDPILPIALIALLASGISMWIFNVFSSTSSKIHDTHTRFALSQITEHLNGVEDESIPRTKTELFSILRASNIDWNSCGLEGDQILDGWGQPITATFDESLGRWTFRSTGEDAEMGTEDDIESATTPNKQGEH
jgi:hypothetical protein